MKTIKLQRLELSNFQGGSFVIEPQGQDTNVFGDNGTGKTRLASALTWLLFGKDSLGRSDFEIKNVDARGEQEHGLEHAVEGVFDVAGKDITLKKVYHEVWTKKRGNVKPELTGNTTDHYVDAVPCQKKDFDEAVAEIAKDESIFRLLTSPAAFPALPALPTADTIKRRVKTQREILFEICGNISDAEVIESDKELFELSSILMQRSIDDHRKKVAARRTEINKEIDKLPVRIDEVSRSLPDVTGLDRGGLTGEIQRLETLLSDAKLRHAGVDTGGNLAELSKQLTVINTDVAKLENTHRLNILAKVTKLNYQITELEEKKTEHDRRENGIARDIEFKQKRIDEAEPRLPELREQWAKVNAEQFADTTEDVCPACGQALPHDRVQTAREKALAEFNRSKAERLGKITTEGQKLAAQITQEKEEIAHLRNLRDPSADLNDQIATITAQRDALKATADDLSTLPGRAELLAQKEALEARIQAEKDGKAEDREKAQAEIDRIDGELRAAKEKADLFPKREQGEKRIEELKQQERALAAEFEKLEHELYLCDQFVRAKVRMLTGRINAKFEIARFKLFEQQVNGGIAECCEITVNGVPYNGGLNNAARINAGLDVCRTLARHYGLLAPVFVDNAESISQLIEMDAQVIRLVVSEPDKTLRVETRPPDTLFGKRVAA